MDNPKYLRYMVVFTHIIKHGSISAAAQHLDIAKSVISQQLSSLEKELGTKLVNRTTRRMVLTPAGRDFYQHCLNLINLTETAWNEAREHQSQLSGSIRMTAPHVFMDQLVTPAVSKLIKKNPHVRPELMAEDNRLDLFDHSIDLAIRAGSLPSSELTQTKIADFQDVLVASKGFIKEQTHALNHLEMDLTKNQRTICELPYIANHWQGKRIQHSLLHSTSQLMKTLLFSASCQSNSVYSVIELTREGLGVSAIPNVLLGKFKDLVPILPGFYIKPTPLYALHAFGSKPPTLISEMIKLLKQEGKFS